MKSLLKFHLPCLALVAVLAGCASPARIDQMRVDTSLADRTAVSASPLKANIAIKDVTGGKETNPLWVSNVGSSEFERALEVSLQDAGLLSANRQGSKYTLIAHLLKLDQPFMGASMTVTTTVQYTLLDRASGKELFSRTLVTPYTAAWNASFIGAERLKLANEGAVRENIKQLIGNLIALPAGSVEVK